MRGRVFGGTVPVPRPGSRTGQRVRQNSSRQKETPSASQILSFSVYPAQNLRCTKCPPGGRTVQFGFNPGGRRHAPTVPDKQSRTGQTSSAYPPAFLPHQKALPRHCPVTRANPQLTDAEPYWMRGPKLKPAPNVLCNLTGPICQARKCKFSTLAKKSHTVTVAGSTFTPGPIVEVRATL